jgi:hypothetical protein
MSSDIAPPPWAERLLCMLLAPADREAVSGDLLEAYRDEVHPARGRAGADWWYLRQIAWFAWRATWLWATLLAAAVIGRDVLDWQLSPTTDFYARSVVSTSTAVGIYVIAGFAAARRLHSVAAGALTGVAMGAIAAVMIEAFSLLQLAMWHDPHTLAMIKAAGGLSEVFTLPVLVIAPGTLCAAIGAISGRAWTNVVSRVRVN